MIGKRMILSRPVGLPEVKDILKDRAEAGVELTYEQNLTNEYAKKFSKVSASKAKKLSEQIREVNNEIPEDINAKILDFMPTTADQLRLIVPKTVKMDDSQQSKILDLVKEASH